MVRFGWICVKFNVVKDLTGNEITATTQGRDAYDIDFFNGASLQLESRLALYDKFIHNDA